MKSKISAFMDGELHPTESSEPFVALREHGEARDAWNTYHLISDAMRDTRLLSGSFSARVAAKLAEEPTVIAPRGSDRPAARTRWRALSAAASVAAVALVGWFAFAPQQGAGPAPQVAQAPQPAAAVKEAAQVPPPETAGDYLLAHQGYSPRNSLQGMAPYVRMVSGEAGARRR